MKTTKPMLEYLATCSKTSLQSFELARLNDRANLRKQMIEILDELIEMDIQARIAEWLLAQRQHTRMQRAQRRIRRDRTRESATLSLPFSSPDATTDSATLAASLAAFEKDPLMRVFWADATPALRPPSARQAAQSLTPVQRGTAFSRALAPPRRTAAAIRPPVLPPHSPAALPEESSRIA
jgi:hypothetical protein